MTPENIHINSFMYEPILDMSNEHLKQLYKNVSSLPVGEIEKINKFYSSSKRLCNIVVMFALFYQFSGVGDLLRG